MPLSPTLTGSIGDQIMISGGGLDRVSHVYFNQQPAYGSSAQFYTVNQYFLQATIPQNAQWGEITLYSAFQNSSGQAPEKFVPAPQITSLDTYTPLPGSIITASGHAFSGVTGAFFGSELILGEVLSSSVTDIKALPITVPTGNISGSLKLMGQSGVVGEIHGLEAGARLIGITPASGFVGDQVILSGENIIPETVRSSNGLFDVSFNGGIAGFGSSGSNVITGYVPDDAYSGSVNLINLRGDIHTGGIDFHVRVSAPYISSLDPSSGVPAGNRAPAYYSITGRDFVDVEGLFTFPSGKSFDISTAHNLLSPLTLSYNRINNKNIIISSPSGTGYMDLVVQTAHGTGWKQGAYFAKYEPTIIGFAPRSAELNAPITITGSGYFPDSLSVYFSGSHANNTFLNQKILATISGVEGDPLETSTDQQVITVRAPGMSSACPYKLVVDNGVGGGVISTDAFNFVGAPEITGVTPLSGNHGDQALLGGSSLGGVSSVSHGSVSVTTFEASDADNPTGLLVTIPPKSSYIEQDSLYRNRNEVFSISNSNGVAYSSDKFLVIPPSVVCSGFHPEFQQRGGYITVTGGNIELVTGIHFSGNSTNTGIATVRVDNRGPITQILPTGNVQPKTGIQVRVPAEATNGPIRLETEYSSCETTGTFYVDITPDGVTVSPTTGLYGDTITLSGDNTHGSSYYIWPVYTSGTLDMSDPVNSGSNSLNFPPTLDYGSPDNVQYLTNSEGVDYVTFDIPRGLGEKISIYTVRKGVSNPKQSDFRSVAFEAVTILPTILGISHSQIKVGDTLYVTGINAFNTFENAIGISGTGLAATYEPESPKQLEFLSKYNTKIDHYTDNSEASFFNLGDYFLPNDPALIVSKGDGQAFQYNADIRKNYFQRGLLNSDATGVFVLPIQIGDNFVGTGHVFMFMNEESLLLNYRQNIVTPGPDSFTYEEKLYQGRYFSEYDFDNDGKADKTMWSGATKDTNYHNKGLFHSGFTGSYTMQRWEDVKYKSHTLEILPEVLTVNGISPLSGFQTESFSVHGSGLSNITGIFLHLGGGSSSNESYKITLGGSSNEKLTATIPTIAFNGDSLIESGYLSVHSSFSKKSTTSNLESGYLKVIRPPKITGFSPSRGIAGETEFLVGGYNLQLSDSFELVSRDTSDAGVSGWGFTGLSNGSIGISGITPGQDIFTPLPQEVDFEIKKNSPSLQTSMGKYTIVKGDLDVYGDLRVHQSAYVKDKLVSSGNTFVHGDIDVSGDYLLDGSPLKLTDPFVYSLPRENKILHLSASDEASYTGAGATAWQDISRNKNTAALVNSPTFNTNELKFNGIDQYATLPMTEHLKPQSFTLGAVFRPNEVGGTIATPIIEAPNLIPTELVSYQIAYDSTRRFYSTLTFTDNSSSTIFTSPVNTGMYHMVHSTWDGSNHKIYLSGAEESSDAVGAKTISYTNQDLNILTNTSVSRFVEGDLREIYMFSGSKSPTEINQIFDETNNIYIYDRNVTVSGGYVKTIAKDDPSKSVTVEDNKIILTGDNAEININGIKLKPGEEKYAWDNVIIGDKTDYVTVQGTGTSTALGTSDTLVGSLALEMASPGEWRNIKVAFGTFLNSSDSIKNFTLKERDSSDSMNWPYKANNIDALNNSDDASDYTYITEGTPTGAFLTKSPLVLDLYAQRNSSYGTDVVSHRSIYSSAVYGTGSGVGNWNITSYGNVELNFKPNTGVGSIVGTALHSGDGSVDTFLLEYTETNTEQVFVSLDGIELAPYVDYTLVDSTGVKITAAPAVGEEVLLRQISDSVVTQPLYANISIPLLGSGGITFSDLSTGTNISFSGNVSGLNIDNYNIYDSNVNITGGGQTIHNEYSGIDVDITNNASATAVNLYTEPGGATTVSSTNANVVVANEGVNANITNNSNAYIYAETGAGKVNVYSGYVGATGNIHITGGTNEVSGAYSTIAIYDSDNTIYFTESYSGDANITGLTVNVVNSGRIDGISGSPITINDSTLNNVNYSGSGIVIQGNSTAYISGNSDTTLDIDQNGGTANYTFSGNSGDQRQTITANAGFTALGYGNTRFDITGNDATINSSSDIYVDTDHLTAIESTLSVTGNAIQNIGVTGNSPFVTNIDINNGNLSFTGNADSTNIISGANTVQSTGSNYYIYNSTVTIGGS